MKRTIKNFVAFFIAVAFINPVLSQDTLQNNMNKVNIDEWPETAKMAAQAMMDKYGDPHEQTTSMLIWHDTAPFTKTIVYKEEIQHNFPMPHKDVLEQVINHDAPVDKYDDIAQYDGSVILERTKGTIAARCDKEAANFLALNLAHDILEDKRSVEEAREYYANAIMKMMQGEQDAYLEGLQFQLPNEDITNPDETVMDMSKVKEMKEQNKSMNQNQGQN